MKRCFLQAVFVCAAVVLLSDVTNGKPVNVPNFSFESPVTSFVDINITSWQKTPRPLWYDESGGFYWNQLTGVFMNVDPNDPAYIDNCDGKQAAWLFAVPEAGLYQDINDTFEAGYCYDFTVGVIGGSGNMKDGVPLEIRLYYRDANNTKVTIGAATTTYDANSGLIKHFNDVRLILSNVLETDPWANKKIGIEIVSALTLADLDPVTGRAGGFWDIDNVRLNKSLTAPIRPVDVPNYSFESPATSFVDINITSWQKTSRPLWYDESGGFYWNQLTGVYMNVGPNDPAYIDNCDGKQAAWLFAVPEAGLYQDLNDTFEAGYCYDFTVGVIGGSGNMKDGVPLEIRLYYRDANNTKITIGAVTTTYDVNSGYVKHFNDVWITLPAVKETDPWANKKIGIEIVSALTLADLDPVTGRAGGFWDIDNVRVNQFLPAPVIQKDVPNASFELPATQFVDVNIASWQKTSKPLWYDESGGFYWNQLTGVYMNVDPNDPAYIDNCDGKQAAWLFAVPEAGLYQDINDTFEAGYCYDLAVGFIGGNGNMKDDVPLEIRLYYRDANNTKITIGAASTTYDASGGYVKHFNDVWITLPTVKETDPWANKKIGIEIVSALTLADLDPVTGRAGGFWDIDNVRLLTAKPDYNGETTYIRVIP
jgi:hypothetical protein